MSDEAKKRERFDQTVADLVGRRITSVEYWTWSLLNDASRRWDYGEWHHAERGVELSTDQGPISLRCTDTFWPYGIEATPLPMSELIGDRSEQYDATRSATWGLLLSSPIRRATTHWESLGFDRPPAPGRGSTVVVPLGIRLDFEGGTVWLIAGIPQPPDMREVFVPGDEIMVVFSADRVREIGFPEGFANG